MQLDNTNSSINTCHTNGKIVKQTETTTLLDKPNGEINNDTTTTAVAIVNCIKYIYGGAGMLSLPWSFSHSSLIPGIIGLTFGSMYSCLTCIFVLHACEITQIFEYSELLKSIHPYCEVSSALIVIYVTLSTLLSYFILIGDFTTEAINGINPHLRFDYDRQIYITIAFLVILLPLSLLKQFKALKISSFVGNIATTYCVILIVAFAVSEYCNRIEINMSVATASIEFMDFNYGILIVTNVVSKASVSHYSIPVMYQQLRQRNTKTMTFIIVFSYSLVTIIYLMFAIAGYYLFGSNTQSDVFNNFPNDSILFIVARLGYNLSIIGAYPIAFKSCLQTIENKFFNNKRGSRFNFIDNKCIRIFVILFCGFSLLIIALFVDDVGPVSSIEGAVTVLFLICIFPVLMVWKIGLVNKEITQNRIHFVVFLGTLLLIGIGLGVGGIILQINLLRQ